MHCAASMLREKLRERLVNTQQYQKLLRSESSPKAKQSYAPLQFSPAETKLLYTLHWILLDAASECKDAEMEGNSGKSRMTKNRFLHDLSSLQLFIYLFAPIVEQLAAADFETLKLESGLAIWVPLMSYRQPLHSTLPIPVKLYDLDHLLFCHPWTGNFSPSEIQRPNASTIASEPHMNNGKMIGGIYLGEERKAGLTTESKLMHQIKPFGLNLASDSIPNAEANSDGSEEEPENLSPKQSVESDRLAHPTSPVVSTSRPVSTPPKALPETVDEDDTVEKTSLSSIRCEDEMMKLNENIPPGYARIQQLLKLATNLYVDNTNNGLKTTALSSAATNGADIPVRPAGSACLLATHCDLSVIRCLFCADWSEAGVYWSLRYLFLRLLEIRTEWFRLQQETRKLLKLARDCMTLRQLGYSSGTLFQSQNLFGNTNWRTVLLGLRSLSTPDLLESGSFTINSSRSTVTPPADYGGHLTNDVPNANSQKDTCTRFSSNRAKGKGTLAGLLSQTAKGSLDSKYSTETDGSHTEPDRGHGIRGSRLGSGIELRTAVDDFSSTGSRVSDTLVTDASLSLALPIVTFGGSRLGVGLPIAHQPSWKSAKKSRIADIKERFTRTSKAKPNESTESERAKDTSNLDGLLRVEIPSRSTSPNSLPTTNSLDQIRSHHSLDSARFELESSFSSRTRYMTVQPTPSRPSSKDSPDILDEPSWDNETSADQQVTIRSLYRSASDFEIIYAGSEKVEEVPGAMHYISSNGQIEYSVLLRGLYWCSTVHTSPRVCCQLLKCLCALFDLGILDSVTSHSRTPQFIPRKPINLKKLRKKLKSGPTGAHMKRVKPINSRSHAPAGLENRPQQPDMRRPTAINIPSTRSRKEMSKLGRRTSAILYVGSDESEEDEEPEDDHRKAKKFEDIQGVAEKRSSTLSRLGASFPTPGDQTFGGRSGASSPEHHQHHHLQSRYTLLTRGWAGGRHFSQHTSPRSIIMRMGGSVCNSAWRHRPPSPLQTPTLNKQTIRKNHTLAIEMVMRILRFLGCNYDHHGSPMFGCRDSYVDQNAKDRMMQDAGETRRLVHDCLIHLYELNRVLFVRVVSRMVASMNITDLMELFHALTGFCLDPAARRGVQGTQADNRSGNYANCFGQSTFGHGTRGAEGIVVSCMLGPFIRRLVRCRSELISQENMSLFSDIRQLLMYLREVHGSTFRRNMLVAMMCPIQRACERPQPKLPPNWSRMSTRNSMWLLPRADKRRSSSLFSDGIGDYDLSGPGAGAAPLTRGQRFTSWQALLPRSSVMGRGIRLNSTAGQLFSSDKSTDPLRARGEPELNTTQLVIEHRWVNTPALKEGLRDFAFLMECCEPGTIPEPQLVAALLDLDAPVVARACLLLECANLVHRCNRGEWASWMKFNLPSTYQPGTASAAHVGQRLSPNAGGVNGSGGIPDMMVVKRNAGNLFHAWGEALGSRVRHFVHVMNSNMNQSASNASIVTFTGVAGSGGAVGGGSSHGGVGGSCTGNGATAMAAATPTSTTTSTSDKHRDSVGRLFSVLENEENFLDDASVNPTGESCPYALLAVGVQLLLEITTYLREMHPRLPQASTTEDKHKPSSDQGTGGSTPGTGSISGPSGTKLGTGTDRGLGKLAGSSGPRASFRAARRRLSILMPIFGSGGSVNVEESTAELEEDSSSAIEQIAPGRRALGSRRISFAVFSDNKEGRNSLLGSASSLDRSPDSDKSLLSKSLLRHRGSGSFKRESPTKQENLGVYGRYGGRFGMRARSNSGEAYTKLLPDAEDPSVSQDTEEDAKQSDTESQRANAKSSKSSKSTAELRPNRAKSQNASSRIRATEDQLRTHTTVRRSVSAALTTRRQRTSSIFSQTNANAGDSINGDQIVCSTNMPWIDPVIEFLNHTNFSCDHQNYCAPNCFERQQHQCRALLNAVNQIYGSDVENSFVKSIERQMGASSGENATRPGAEDSVTRSRSGPPTVKSFDLTDESSDSDPSSRAGSTEDMSAGSDGNSYSHNPASGSHLVSKLTTGKYAGARSEFHAVRSHDGLSRLNKSGGGDSDVDLQALLSQRTDSIIPIEIHKPRSTLFSKSSRRKESQFSNLSGRRDSTSLLEKFRLRSSNRGSTNGPTEPDGLGLTSLLGLSVLAGAGAGLLQSASSPGPGGVGLWAMGETSEFEGNGDPCERMNPTRNNFRATNNPELPIQRYLVNQVKNLRSSPFDLLNKSALLLTTQQMTKVLPLAWELLLEPEEDLISSAACFILFCGVRSPATVQDILLAEMQHELPSQRLNAILRFRALWTHRYHVWSRLDEGAPNQLRLPPSIIEFVLPSPTLGYPGYEAPDPVWQIRKGTSAEEVQLKQNEATKTFVTASTSRRKQQQELLVRALAAEAIRRRDARRHFHLTTCPVLERAAIEPAFSKEHRDEGTDDGPNSATGVGPGTVGGAISSNSGAASSSSGGGGGGVGGVCSGSVGVSAGAGGGSGGGSGASSSMQEEFAAAVRRLSVAPINRNLWNQTRNSSWRQGSIPWFRTCAANHDDEDRGGTHSLFPSQPLQQAQSIFPSALCAATVPLIHLLDDTSVNEQGMAVNTVAEFVVFQCLLEDTALFLRFILERLTRTKHKDELIFVLRKMIQRLPELPMQAAHAIFNNLVGYIMFHIRTPCIGAPEAIASALSIVHLVVPHIQNIYFKDLKQTMRREQIDLTLLLTANLPCAKQFNVFDNDIGVAQLVRLQDENKDYQFDDILKDVLEANGIPIEESHSYFLFDERSNIIRNSSHYVRDFYPFKRNHTPKMRLKQLNKEQGLYLLQRNALNLKFQEIGKVLFTNAVLNCTPSSQISNHVFFLHEELTKLPSFPRRALESEFNLYNLLELGRPLFGLDTIHKLSWCQLLSNLFSKMPNTYPWSSDLQLFLNVYNGTLILHAEDSSVLRQCLAFYIQCCYQFKTAFSTSGYAGILPTLLRVYNQQVNNAVLTHAVEFTCRQFYVMHRTPFVLQLFGSLANYVLIGDETATISDDFYRIQPATLYRLLRSINRPLLDNLKILELCDVQKPLRALDFCYEDDDANWSVLDAINLCVTVIVYAPDSYRAKQMLVILQAILPFILRDLPAICAEENCGTEPKKAEIVAVQKISTTMRQLISTTEFMTRRVEDVRQLNIHAPGGPIERRPEPFRSNLTPSWSQPTSARLVSVRPQKDTESPGSRDAWDTAKRGRVGGLLTRVDSLVSESRTGVNVAAVTDQPMEPLAASRWNYEPREIILQLACDFLSCCSARLAEMGERQRIPELLDPKSHVRLSELAQSFIKQVPTNPDLLSGTALQRYFLEILPLVEWGHESMRSCKALESLLNRINRTLPKLLENFALRPHPCWDDVVKIIHSVYLVIRKNRTIAHLKEVRVLIETLKKAVIFDPSGCLPALVRPKPEVHTSHSAWSGISNAVPGRPSLGETLFNTITPETSTTNASVSGRGPGKGRSPNNGEIAAHGGSNPTTNVLMNRHGMMDSPDAIDHGVATRSFKFAAEVVRLIALVLQVMGSNFCLKDLCERSGPDYNNRCPAMLEGGFPTLATYLGQLIIPLLFRCCAGRKDSPCLSKENVFYALDVCITALFAPETSTKSPFRIPTGQPQYLEPRHSISPERHRDKPGKHPPEVSALAVPTIGFQPSSTTATTIAAGLMDLAVAPNTLRLMNLSSLGPDPETGPYSALPRLIYPTLSGISCVESAECTNQRQQQQQQQQVPQQEQLSVPPLSSLQTPPSQQQQQQCPKQTSSQQKTQQQQQQKMLQSNPQSLKHGGKHEVSSGTGLGYATNLRTRASVISTGVKPSLTLSKSKTPSTNTRLLDPSTLNALSVGERPTKFKAEFAHRLGFLGLKLILVAYSRHASVRLRLLTATLTKLALNGRSGIQLWKFFDFLTTHRPPLFVHLLPFIRFKLGRLQCATPGEQAYQQIVSQKLIGLHLPVPQTTAAVLRELMLELGTIQHDVQHFTQTQFQELQPTRSTHESVRRLYSTDHSPAVQKRSSRKVKTKLSGLAEESSRQESEVSLLDHANLSNRVDVLASVTSESACSSEQLFDDNGFGLPSLGRTSRGVRNMSQGLRQSILIRDPRKRIGAHDGSRMLTQNQRLKQSDPILTASAESILRQSQNVSHRKTRQTSITKSESAQPVASKSHLAKANFLLSDATFDEQSLGSFTSDELRGPVGPAAAAAIATSLYGSGAPYIHARDKARQELALLVGISPPEVETSTDRRDSSNLDLSLSDQSLIHTAASKLDTVARGGTGLGVKSGRPESRTQKAKTPQRASKIDYV